MTNDSSNLDASTFDLDGWIDGIVRPEVTVVLYPNDAAFASRLKVVTDRLPAAEKVKPEDRGLDDPSPEALQLQVAEINAEREASALRVRLQQRTKLERGETLAEAHAAGALDSETVTAWLLSAAMVEPKFTPEQILRLLHRDDTGEQMVLELLAAHSELDSGLTPPFSREPSGGTPA